MKPTLRVFTFHSLHALIALLLLGGSTTVALAAASTLRLVDGFNRNGALKWTNDVLTTAPVYEIFRSTTVTGAWSHLKFVTNQTSSSATNPLTAAEFYKIGWVKDAETTFDYMFDEGYGVPSVVGQLKLTFVPGPTLGTWSCDDFLMVDYLHPIGNGQFVSGGIFIDQGSHAVALAFTPVVADSGVFLVGDMDIGNVGGRPAYTGFSGYVYINGIAGPSEIGFFSATRH